MTGFREVIVEEEEKVVEGNKWVILSLRVLANFLTAGNKAELQGVQLLPTIRLSYRAYSSCPQ